MRSSSRRLHLLLSNTASAAGKQNTSIIDPQEYTQQPRNQRGIPLLPFHVVVEFIDDTSDIRRLERCRVERVSFVQPINPPFIHGLK